MDWDALVDAPLAVIAFAMAFMLVLVEYRHCKAMLANCWRRIEACHKQRVKNGFARLEDTAEKGGERNAD